MAYQHLCANLCFLLMTYPCNPSPAVCAEGDFPCWLQRLEKFVWLEEGLDAERIDDAKGDEKYEDVL